MNRNENKEGLEFLGKQKVKALEAVTTLLNKTIPKLRSINTVDWSDEHLWELLSNCMDFCCFFNPLIIDELKQLKLTPYTLKWFISSEQIWNEIERIEKMGIMKFSKFKFIAAIHFHIQDNVFVSILDDFGKIGQHNGRENVNIVTQAILKFYQRRQYQMKHYSTKENCELENKLNEVADTFSNLMGQESDGKKILTGLTRGKTNSFLMHLNNFEELGGSRNQCYLALFDLIKLVIKHENLLDEKGYHLQEKYDRSFNDYKVAMVKRYITT